MSLFAAAPDAVHFYSYATGVSIELPVGFTLDDEDDVSATYVDDEDEEAARVQVRVAGAFETADPAAAARDLAGGFARANELVRQRDLVVDEAPASTVVSRRPDGWLLHQTVLAGDGKLLTVVAVIPPARAAELAPDLDTAVDSIRLITL